MDTHAHLTVPEFAGELPEVLWRAAQANVEAIVCVGVDIPSSREAIEIARRYPGVVATVGVHPNESAGLAPCWLEELRELSRSAGVVAVGEIGLDYYRQRTGHQHQQELFRAQLELAREVGLPVVVHNREADGDLTGILREWVSDLPAAHPRGVLHCFSGDFTLMQEGCALGFYISFAGPITYRNAWRSVQVAAAVPADRLLLETDSPYLAPHPHRGRRNEPAFVRLVAERMAEIRGETLDRVAETTSRNAATLFGLEAFPASQQGR